MALTATQKAEVLAKYRRQNQDTGSPEVQVALLTARLNYLTEHFKKHTKDHHSRTGLMRLVSQRRRLLDYLHQENPQSYRNLISELGIRK